MKKYFMFATIVALLFANFARAQDRQTTATVTKVTGSATFKTGSGAAQAIAVGTEIPQGAEITTGDNSEVTIKAHDGIVAVAGAKTTIAVEALSVSSNGTRTATIGLRSGNLASSLDPSRRAQNNYSVRTPKGVAAARGTAYTVSYDGVTYRVTVVQGVVQSFTATGGNSVNVGVGLSASSGALESQQDTTPLAQSIAENPNMAAGLALVSAAVAANATNINDVTAVINAIASLAGTGQAATNAVAAATASAAATAATNSNLNRGDAAPAAAAIVGAAVSGSVAAGNGAAAGTIVATTTAAVASVSSISIPNLATILVDAAQNTPGVVLNISSVIEAAGRADTSRTITADTTVIGEANTTPITTINPDIVSPSGGATPP